MYKQVCIDGDCREVDRLRGLVSSTASVSASRLVEDAEQVLSVDDSMEEDVMSQVSSRPSKPERIVDEDGFELVQKGRGRKHG
jgi:hypothetical protein